MFRMTVLFDDQYWIALIEGEENGEGQVYRHIFGGEPGGPEVYLFVLHELAALLRRPAATVEIAPAPARAVNPKRRAREAARSTTERGVSAAAELAMELQRAAAKQERQASARAAREAEAAARYARAQAKAREKRRGH